MSRLLPAIAAVLAAPFLAAQGAPDDLTPRDALLLREAFHLQAELGAEVWPGWAPIEPPVMLLAGKRAWLIGHPAPPEGYEKRHSAVLDRDVHVRARRSNEGDMQATYPIAGHPTVVIAVPDDDANACRWTLVAGHELFHCHQGMERHIDPFTGDYADKHELSYPFPYDDDGVRAALRLEAELVHGLATTAESGERVDRVPARLLAHCATVDDAVMRDERHLLFKRWEEWKEGVARYVERELSRAAADPDRYEPLPEFAARFTDASYEKAWSGHFEGQLKPVRFVGEGVQGRVVFYYLGLGKAVTLDWLMPDWKKRYRETSLDALLLEAARR